MIDPNQDGITHVNIYSGGKTPLGRMLSNFFRFPIETAHGRFESVEGYWYWLSISDCEAKEVLRNLHGQFAKNVGKDLKRRHGERVDPDFQNKILRAIWYKMKRMEHLFEGDIAKLPFEHYYVYGGVKAVDAKNKHPWLVEGISKLRDHILGGKHGS